MEMGPFLSPLALIFQRGRGKNPRIVKYTELLTEETWLILMQDNIIPDILVMHLKHRQPFLIHSRKCSRSTCTYPFALPAIPLKKNPFCPSLFSTPLMSYMTELLGFGGWGASGWGHRCWAVGCVFLGWAWFINAVLRRRMGWACPWSSRILIKHSNMFSWLHNTFSKRRRHHFKLHTPSPH